MRLDSGSQTAHSVKPRRRARRLLNSMENYTVSLALRLFQDQNSTEFNLLMAAALIHIVPVLLLFFFAQRYFVKGIAMSGLKG